MPQEGLPKSIEAQSSFEEQFSHKEKRMLPGRMADITDISPDHPKDGAVLLAPGWSQTANVYKPAMEELVKRERRVVSLDHPRRGGDMSAAPQEALEKYPTEEVRKAMNLLELLRQKDLKNMNVVAHSEGAINAALAAALDTESRIKNIVFYGPAGMIGEDTFTRLLKGFAGQMKRAKSLSAAEGRPEIPKTETEKQVAATAATECLKYLLKNPVRALKEGLAISDTRSQIHEMLRYLHEKGVGIVVMAAVDDPVFPMERMQEIANTDMLDGFVSVRGAHGAIGEHPELFMAGAEEMLTALEKKQEKKQQEQGEPSA